MIRGWKHKIDIKKHLGDDIKNQQAARGVLKEVKKLERHFKDDFEYEQITEELQGLAENTETTANELDETLERLYDWADSERVWLGP